MIFDTENFFESQNLSLFDKAANLRKAVHWRKPIIGENGQFCKKF